MGCSTGLAVLRLQPVNSPLLLDCSVQDEDIRIKHILNVGVQLERLMQTPLLKHLLNINFTTSCDSSIVIFGDLIHTSATCRTMHCGLVASLACDTQCLSLPEAPALWHSLRADFTLMWQEPGCCGSFLRSCWRHGGF